MAKLEAVEYESFEEIKQTDENGNEFWYARDLSVVLQYTQWRNFHKVIDRAMLACQNSGFAVGDHFAEVSKTIQMPKTAEKQVIEYKLTRYACYLVVQNGDPRIDMGTTLPENLPTPDKSIQIIEREEIKKLRNSKTKLMLDE